MNRMQMAVAALAFLLSACGGGGDDDGRRDAQPQATEAPAAALPVPEAAAIVVPPPQRAAAPLASPPAAGPGSEQRVQSVMSGRRLREYTVLKPAACSSNCPVVIDLHDLGSTGRGHLQTANLTAAAAAAGAITVYPDGVGNSWNAGSNAAGACCGIAQWSGVNDVSFLRSLVAKLKADHGAGIDAGRIYATGLGAGCAMAQRLAVEAPEVVAAVSCVGGYLTTVPASVQRPISVTEIHALQDRTVAYGSSERSAGAQANLQRWAQLDSCSGQPLRAVGAAGSVVEEYAECSRGTRVRLYSLPGDQPFAFNADAMAVSRIVWDTLKAERLPRP